MKQSPISIYTGHFGSGKTELSIREAVNWAKKQKTILVDLDIINTYFRSEDERRYLESHGVQVLAPRFASSQVDIPALTPEIDGAFARSDVHLVVDVGGDPEGARALRRYRNQIIGAGYTLYVVVNLMRPFTRSAGEIVDMTRQIEETSQLEAAVLINNTHLKEETTRQLIMQGQAETEKAAQMLGLRHPVPTCALRQWMPEEAKQPIILEPILKSPWEVE